MEKNDIIKNEIKIYSKGEDTISADELANILSSTSSITKKISEKFYDNSKITIDVNKLDKGSILLVLDLTIKRQDCFIDDECGENEIFDSIYNIFNLKKHLKGESPSSFTYNQLNNNVLVFNEYGEMKTFSKDDIDLFSDPKLNLDYDISRMFKLLSPGEREDLNIEINDKSNSFSKNDFKLMAKRLKTKGLFQTKRTTRLQTTLILMKINFFDNKWNFIWEQDIITVKIIDNEFMTKIQNNQLKFGYCDLMTCELEYDDIIDLADVIIRTVYKITKVLSISSNGEQMRFNL